MRGWKRRRTCLETPSGRSRERSDLCPLEREFDDAKRQPVVPIPPARSFGSIPVNGQFNGGYNELAGLRYWTAKAVQAVLPHVANPQPLFPPQCASNLQIFKNSSKVIIELGRMRFSNSADFSNDFIIHWYLPAISSILNPTSHHLRRHPPIPSHRPHLQYLQLHPLTHPRQFRQLKQTSRFVT